MGRHKRYHAPRSSYLGQKAQILCNSPTSSFYNAPTTTCFIQKLAKPTVNLAILHTFLAKSISFGYFLRYFKQQPHFSCRSGHQCDDICCHRCFGDAFGGRDSGFICVIWYPFYHYGCLDLYNVITSKKW